LSESDKIELQTRSKANSLDYRYVVRAKIILLCAAGKSYKEIANELKVGRSVISIWKVRFISNGLIGLQDQPRSVAPATYSVYDKVRVIQKACSRPKGGYSNWSQRRIAKECNMSQTTVH